jgi:hypothetical protein
LKGKFSNIVKNRMKKASGDKVAQYAILKAFYNSDKWLSFRNVIIAERGPICETCGKVIANPKDCEVDHYPTELTPENVSDANISLNPANVKVRCHDCHNIRHHRFCRQYEHGVYLVFGPPLSGKTSLVRENMERGDLVVDMDALFCAVSLQPEYDKPNQLLNNVIGLRNQLIDNIKTRYGKWASAWVIGGYEDKYRREALAADIGAELIFCDVSKDECMRRLETDVARQCRKDEWKRYIDRWFERYVA